jgi:RNA polymerase sigma-70 factor (ECF subfamily)
MNLIDAVKKAQQGDVEAFGWLYDEFAQRIFRYVRLKVQNKQQAEDLLQEVFVKVHAGLKTLRIEDLNFSAWIYKIASNTINDYFRKNYRSPNLVPIEEHPDLPSSFSVEREYIALGERETLRKALLKLPENYRSVLQLRFVEDFTLTETAQILSKSNLAVRLAQHRGIKKLKEILKEFYDLGY